MFPRKKPDGDQSVSLADRLSLKPATPPEPAKPEPPFQQNRTPMLPPRPTAPDLTRPSPDMLRRPTDPLHAASAPVPPKAPQEAEIRQLIVGREISLSGEIKSCDRLIVEGSVEANLQSCQDVNIAESGLFRGAATIDDAEIRGRFEGTLTVRNRLFIRSTGRVTGTVRYGQIEIECGGQISGDIQAQPIEPNDMPEPRRERTPQAVVDLGPSRLG